MRRTFTAALFLASGLAFAQEGQVRVGMSKLDLETYRLALSAERRGIMEANIAVDLDKRRRFFEVFDAFENERGPLDTERFSVMQRYAAARSGVSEPQAMAMVRAVATLQVKEIQLRERYADRIGKEFGGMVGARFYQVDDVMTTTMRLNALQSVEIATPRPGSR